MQTWINSQTLTLSPNNINLVIKNKEIAYMGIFLEKEINSVLYILVNNLNTIVSQL
jgi:nickel-dependent lactate racemase